VEVTNMTWMPSLLAAVSATVVLGGLAFPGVAAPGEPVLTEEFPVRVTRLLDRPIITPDLHPSIGDNIQGPSLIRVPRWAPNRLANYYLYFADHKGAYIRLAYADALTGPWTIHEPGSLTLEASRFPVEVPPVTDEQLARFAERMRSLGVTFSHDMALEMSAPHIASPDVRVDEAQRRFVMTYHGLDRPGVQFSRAAVSHDGISFEGLPEEIGPSYIRTVWHDGYFYGMAMPGVLLRSRDGVGGFETGPTLFESNQRHVALLKRGNWLHVFWTRVGDAPESILQSRIDISGDWQTWTASAPITVLRPERSWEGADAPIEPSLRSTAYGKVNQLRDPAIFEEDERTYLLYAVAGESGIAIAELHFPDEQ
jgi:hypothetical protein